MPTLTYHLQADNKAEQRFGRYLTLVHASVLAGHALYPQQPLVRRRVVLHAESVVRAVLVLVYREDVQVLQPDPGHLFVGREGGGENGMRMGNRRGRG